MSKYTGVQPPERDATPESLVPDIRTEVAKLVAQEDGWYDWQELKEDKPNIADNCLSIADQILAYLEEQGFVQIDPEKLPLLSEAKLMSVSGIYTNRKGYIKALIDIAKAQRSLDLKSLGIEEE